MSETVVVPALLDQFLAESEWRVTGAADREIPSSGLRLGQEGHGTFLFLLSGSAHVAGTQDGPDRLEAGDLLLATPLSTATVVPRGGRALAVIGAVEPVRTPTAAAPLPDTLVLSRFAAREPAIAQLAGSLGSGRRRGQGPADSVVCARIATTILSVAVRLWAVAGCAPAGWPTRTSDPFLQRAVAAIHQDLSHPWTVSELATLSAMSRTAFAERFRRCFGTTPAEYATRARMTQAERLLAAGRSVSAVARSLGYDSDEGFRRAFRRHAGVAPSAWRSDALVALA
ncbi:helix-turn-helix domain-containing protein [Microbacterium gorillae]|uniref:helix-turn-helix domain-containing protein n=1 Tax=Microbacterium gorillae TaxID=1231063 RepID=UPI00058AD636|nr:AraC family transcriptional regulator [Microbacterium gorillae]